mmetsp:Transcript_2264/g.3137  ORF Transcript_2264/g.3137 Transcript_2264/m.3137 type:complete len:331 (+) Transcript_2264:4200-5192(+)
MRGPRHRHQVAPDLVLSLNPVLNEDGVAQSVVDNVVENAEVMHSVDGDTTVESVVNRAVGHIRLMHGPDHVEVEGVPPKLEGLAAEVTLHVADPPHTGVVAARGVQHHVRTVLARLGGKVALDEHIASEQSNLRPHIYSAPAVLLQLPVVPVSNRWGNVDSHLIRVHGCDGEFLGLQHLKGRGGYQDVVAHLPPHFLRQLQVLLALAHAGGEPRPGRGNLRSVQVQGPVPNPDHLVAVSWELCSVLVAMHGNVGLVLEGACLRTYLKGAVAKEDVLSLQGDVPRVLEDQATLHDDEHQLGRRQVEQHVLPCRNHHALALLRRSLASPSVD